MILFIACSSEMHIQEVSIGLNYWLFFLAIVDFMAFARFPINEGNLTKMRLHEK